MQGFLSVLTESDSHFTGLCNLKIAAIGDHRCLASTWAPSIHKGVTVTQKGASISCPPSGWLLRGGEGGEEDRRMEWASREEAGSFARLGAGMAD